MKSPTLAQAILAVALVTAQAHAATLISNTKTTSVTVNTTTNTTNSNPVITGSVTASAAAGQLVFSNPGANLNNLEFGGTGLKFAALDARKSASQGDNTTFSGNVTYTVAFTLGVAETAQINFSFGYLRTTDENATITWGITGPQAASSISGNITSGTGGTATQTATLTAAGTYTFTLSGTIGNNGAITNGNNQVLSAIDFNNINLQVLSVPEPSVFGLLGSLASLAFLRRRR